MRDEASLSAMSPQRRTALASVIVASVLVVVKLTAGLAAGSLGLLAEAAHSGTDLVAALLAFYAVGYAVKPADAGHPYGHGKAEHLAALAEASFLLLVSLFVGGLAIARLVGAIDTVVDATWWAFAAAGLVIVLDLVRAIASYRTGRRHGSAVLVANAVHFGSDLLGTLAVLAGLIAARAGLPEGDSLAALFVAVIVVAAAVRLMRRNVDVLMDRASADAVEAAREAIARLEPPVELRRLRLRQAAGRTFADVVIGVSAGAVVGQGHAAADRVEATLQRALPDADVVVHVEPGGGDEALRERVRAAAMSVSHVREVHDLVLIDTGATGIEAVVHVKLPGGLPLSSAHAIAEQVESAITEAAPEVVAVQTHLEPLAEDATGRPGGDDAIEEAVVAALGRRPRELRVLRTEQGPLVLLTLPVTPNATLAEAHDVASAASRSIRRALPGVADVVVHTEP